MSVEQPIEMLLVGVAEMIRAAKQGESGSEQVRLIGWGPLLGGGGGVAVPAVPGSTLR